MCGNQDFDICIHKTVSSATITVTAPNKQLAIQAVETTINNAPMELDFKNNSNYIFVCKTGVES